MLQYDPYAGTPVGPCLAVNNGKPSTDYTCGGASNEWTFFNGNQPGTVQLESVSSQLCLDGVNGTGNDLVLNPCGAATASQWFIMSAVTVNGASGDQLQSYTDRQGCMSAYTKLTACESNPPWRTR